MYEELDSKGREIRLLGLQPGEPQDEIRCTLRHARLAEPRAPRQTRLAVKELLKTLPPGWTVHKVLPRPHRFLFSNETEN